MKENDQHKINEPEVEESGFQLLQEKPLTGDKPLQFGHRQIITALEKIILLNDFNLTIGLFGGWGTGKSSVIENLKKNLDDKKIPLVIFDVWKHEGDALRRTFLKELDNQLSSSKIANLVTEKNIISDRVSYSINESIDNYEFNWKRIGKHCGMLLLLVSVFLLPAIAWYNLLNLLVDTDIFKTISIPSISSLIVSIFTGGLLFKYVDSFLKTKKIDTRRDRLQDPYEFEMEFKRLLDNLVDPEQKLVITFDNLDRVSGENALNIISTIKTFLDFIPNSQNKQRVYFIIPCDIVAIKNHLEATLKLSEDSDKQLYIDEFLRKFFNTSIWIPEFYQSELEQFANAKLMETTIREFKNDLLAWMIIRVFNDNPRQIIQFINILASNFMVLKQFCEGNEFTDKDFYRTNVPQLAKFLLLKQRHPKIIESYQKSSIYNLYHADMAEPFKNASFKSLLEQTEDIHIASLEPFFKYRSSLREQQMPGIGNFMDKMIDAENNLLEAANELGIHHNIQAFFEVCQNYWESNANSIYRIKFINAVLELCQKLGSDCGDGLMRSFCYFINTEQAIANFHLLKTELLEVELLNKSLALTDQNRKKINNTILNTVVKGNSEVPLEAKRDLVAYLVKNLLVYTEDDISSVKTFLEASTFDPALEPFFSDVNAQHKIMSEAILNALTSYDTNTTFDDIFYPLKLVSYLEPHDKHNSILLKRMGVKWDVLFGKETKASSEETLFLHRLAQELIRTELLATDDEEKEDPAGLLFVNSYIEHMKHLDDIDYLGWLDGLSEHITDTRLEDNITIALMLRISNLIEEEKLTENGVNIIRRFLADPKIIEFVYNQRSLHTSLATLIQEKTGLIEDFGIHLPSSLMIQVILCWISDGNLNDTYNTILSFYKNFSDTEKADLLSKTSKIFRDKVDTKADIDYLREVGDLITFFGQHDPNRLEDIDFHLNIFGLLAKTSSGSFQEYGYQLWTSERDNLIKESKLLLQRNLRQTVSGRNYNNYLLNEALLEATKDLDLVDEEFITYILKSIIPSANQALIIDIYQDIIIENLELSADFYIRQLQGISNVIISKRRTNTEISSRLEDLLAVIKKKLLLMNNAKAKQVAHRLREGTATHYKTD